LHQRFNKAKQRGFEDDYGASSFTYERMLSSLGDLTIEKIIASGNNIDTNSGDFLGAYFGKRVAYLVVDNYVKNTWSKYGQVKSMLNLSNELFFFQFSFKDGMDAILNNDNWFFRNNPLIIKKWNLDVNLLKEDVDNVSVWVKFHGVPMTAFREDGMSVIATKLNVMQNLKNPRQAARGVQVGPKVDFKPIKQVYRHFSNKNSFNTSSNKKQAAVSRKEVSYSTSYDALNSVKNDDDLHSNMGNLKFVGKGASSGGFLSDNGFFHVASTSSSTTHIFERIDKLER
nr:hypothetical protein [Tanacetum cinerariifolium]